MNLYFKWNLNIKKNSIDDKVKNQDLQCSVFKLSQNNSTGQIIKHENGLIVRLVSCGL